MALKVPTDGRLLHHGLDCYIIFCIFKIYSACQPFGPESSFLCLRHNDTITCSRCHNNTIGQCCGLHCVFPNSYDEAVTPNGMVFGDGASGSE